MFCYLKICKEKHFFTENDVFVFKRKRKLFEKKRKASQKAKNERSLCKGIFPCFLSLGQSGEAEMSSAKSLPENLNIIKNYFFVDTSKTLCYLNKAPV
jgi:hypothetical protein